jgi:integrase
MVNVRIDIHNRGIKLRRKKIDKWKVPDAVKKNILRFLDELELGKVNKGVKISESRQSKYLDMLRIPLQFFNKQESKLTLKDIELFEKALSSGKIKTIKGEPYSSSTKVDLRRGLKIYLKWKLGATKGNKLTDWLDTRGVKKTPDYLKESEITNLYKNSKSASERFLIAVLFDAGARATEFHNIRYEDIQLPEGKDNYVRLTLKEEYSKTNGRVISLYWKHSLEAVSEYVKEREKEGIKSNDPVYSGSYNSARFFLIRLGKKVLKKSIHYHLFRHSSATYYASKLNRQQLCYRYGWAFSSDMPDVYISRSGMENKELDENMAYTEISEVQAKLERQKQDSDIMKEQFEKQSKKIGFLMEHYDAYQDVLNELAEGRKIKIKKQTPEESRRIKAELMSNLK